MKFNWREKVATKRFWLLFVTLVSSNLLLFGVAEGDVLKISAMLTNLGAVVTFLLIKENKDGEGNE